MPTECSIINLTVSHCSANVSWLDYGQVIRDVFSVVGMAIHQNLSNYQN